MSKPQYIIEIRKKGMRRWHPVTTHPTDIAYDYGTPESAEVFALDWLTKPDAAAVRIVLVAPNGRRVPLQSVTVKQDLELMTGFAIPPALPPGYHDR